MLIFEGMGGGVLHEKGTPLPVLCLPTERLLWDERKMEHEFWVHKPYKVTPYLTIIIPNLS